MTPDDFKSLMAVLVAIRHAKEQVLIATGYKKPKRKEVDWTRFQNDEEDAIEYMKGNEFASYLQDGYNITIYEKPIYAYKVVKDGDVQIVERQKIGVEKRLRVHSK